MNNWIQSKFQVKAIEIVICLWFFDIHLNLFFINFSIVEFSKIEYRFDDKVKQYNCHKAEEHKTDN